MINETIPVWDNNFKSIDENMSDAELDTYILDGIRTRGAVLICPGGGYEFISDREGEPIAISFNAAGYHGSNLYWRNSRGNGNTKYSKTNLDSI